MPLQMPWRSSGGDVGFQRRNEILPCGCWYDFTGGFHHLAECLLPRGHRFGRGKPHYSPSLSRELSLKVSKAIPAPLPVTLAELNQIGAECKEAARPGPKKPKPPPIYAPVVLLDPCCGLSLREIRDLPQVEIPATNYASVSQRVANAAVRRDGAARDDEKYAWGPGKKSMPEPRHAARIGGTGSGAHP